MTQKKRFMIVGAVALVACAVAAVVLLKGSSSSKKRWTLRQEWIPQMTFTGEVVAQNRRLFGDGMDVEIRPGGFENDPIKLVESGVDDFGVAGAERVLQANEKGASLVVIGVVNHVSPTVFLTLRSNNITEPKQFEGRAVGVLSGSNTEVVYQALMKRTGVDRTKIREQEISYDLPGFIKGTFDVLPAFAYDEPLSLKKEGVDFVVIDPRSHGVKAMGNVYFTRRSTLEKHPEKVRAFVVGVREGWKYAFEHPDESIKLLASLDPKLDLVKERESLLIARDYFMPSGTALLEIRRADWEAEVELLRSIGYLKGSVDLSAALATPQ